MPAGAALTSRMKYATEETAELLDNHRAKAKASQKALDGPVAMGESPKRTAHLYTASQYLHRIGMERNL